MTKYRWGILAPGKMSSKFTRSLKLLKNVELHAVGSRDTERAEKFAREYGFRKYYGSYEELAADPDIDIIYIASPHSYHKSHTLLCLKNGKNVICEKAFALNLGEVEEMVSEAGKHRLFLMEALWPPFQPFYKSALEIINSGVLGEIRHLHGYFSFIPPYDIIYTIIYYIYYFFFYFWCSTIYPFVTAIISRKTRIIYISIISTTFAI